MMSQTAREEADRMSDTNIVEKLVKPLGWEDDGEAEIAGTVISHPFRTAKSIAGNYYVTQGQWWLHRETPGIQCANDEAAKAAAQADYTARILSALKSEAADLIERLAAPVGGMELETTKEERAVATKKCSIARENGSISECADLLDRLLRDFDRLHAALAALLLERRDTFEALGYQDNGKRPLDAVAKDIIDLADRRAEAAEAREATERAAREKADAALRTARRAYVNLMHGGYERIVALGGECDSPEVMESGDPAIRAIDAALGATP